MLRSRRKAEKVDRAPGIGHGGEVGFFTTQAAKNVYGREYAKVPGRAKNVADDHRTREFRAMERENVMFSPLFPEDQYRKEKPFTADSSRQSDSDELRKDTAKRSE